MRGRSWRRAAIVGFIAGFVIAPIAMVLALLVPVIDLLRPLLTPGALLLRPLIPAMSGWPGWVNILLAAVANGVVFAVLVTGIVLLVLLVRRGPHDPAKPPRQQRNELRR